MRRDVKILKGNEDFINVKWCFDIFNADLILAMQKASRYWQSWKFLEFLLNLQKAAYKYIYAFLMEAMVQIFIIASHNN